MSLHERPTWEYRVDTDLGEERLNALGAEGWELVAVQEGAGYFKRPRLGFKERVTLEQREHYFASRAGAENGENR